MIIDDIEKHQHQCLEIVRQDWASRLDSMIDCLQRSPLPSDMTIYQLLHDVQHLSNLYTRHQMHVARLEVTRVLKGD